jgi:hypothetical protein
MEIRMQEHELLNLMKDRAHYLSLLKEIYLKKQKSFVEPDEAETKRLNELHEIFLKEMLHLEEKWQSVLKKIKLNNNLHTESTDIILSLTLDEDMITQYFAYKDKMYQLLGEIERIKKNSDLMANNAFPFIQKKPGSRKSNSRMSSAFSAKTLKIENFKSRKDSDQK